PRPRPPPTATLLPYTTLFRSPLLADLAAVPPLHGIGEILDLRGRQPQCAADIANGAARPVADDGGRKRGARASILFIDVLDDFLDRKSTRLNSSHVKISYAVF